MDIISKIEKAELYSFPFPHIYIEDFLPHNIYQELLVNFPTFEEKEFTNNVRLQYSMKDFWEDPDKFKFYINFQQDYFNEAFHNAIFEKFKDYIDENLEVKLRNTNIKTKPKDNITYFDLQPGINTPVTRSSSVRKPHIDSHTELFAGLLYLRDPNDTSTGGDLELYSSNKKVKFNKIKEKKDEQDRIYFKKNEVLNPQDIKLEKTIPYSSNNFIFFLNSKQSIHGVSPRSGYTTRS
jgi:hypothetical protein